MPQAARRGNAPLVEALLSAGARLDTEDAAGLTAVDHAVLCRTSHPDSGEPGGGAGAAVLRALLPGFGERRLNTHRTRAGDSSLMLAVNGGDQVGSVEAHELACFLFLDWLGGLLMPSLERGKGTDEEGCIPC
jgi:hypothetical protein